MGNMLDVLGSSTMLGKRKADTEQQRGSSLRKQHLLSVREFDMDKVSALLVSAERMKVLVKEGGGGDDRLKHRVLASVFYEPSTRTSCSFQAAMLRLGGSVVSVNADHSSVQKGESLEDTIQTMGCYCDAIVLRHPVKGSALQASKVSANCPIINAGDGVGEHPTQALLDLFTIQTELGRVGQYDPRQGISSATAPLMTVTLLGDLKNGRTVHSLVKLLALFPGIRLIYVAPAALAMPQELVEEIRTSGAENSTSTLPHSRPEQITHLSLDEAIAETDVLYVTRVQKERFATAEEYEAVKGSYCVDAALMLKAKKNMIVMHPLPRLQEISTDVDADPRAAYFRQMENGMYMRMAILDAIIRGP